MATVNQTGPEFLFFPDKGDKRWDQVQAKVKSTGADLCLFIYLKDLFLSQESV